MAGTDATAGIANMRWTTLVLLACSAAVEAFHLASPVPRASAGAAKPRIATAATMKLDVIPLFDSTSPGFLATRFVLPVVGGSVLAGLVRRPVAKLVVGVVSLLLAAVLCVLPDRTTIHPRRHPRRQLHPDCRCLHTRFRRRRRRCRRGRRRCRRASG